MKTTHRTQKISSQIQINQNGFISVVIFSNFPVICYDSWIHTVFSTDTVYRYLPDHSMKPFMIRTPSIESKNPESLLYPVVFTERYYFLQIQKMKVEVKGTTPADVTVFYPQVFLTYDRQEKAIYEYTLYNEDYTNKKTVDMMPKAGNNEIAFWQKIEADELVEDYEKDVLKGRLKEIASTLEEESNPVIMLVKHKK